jgi:hypothetical protein
MSEMEQRLNALLSNPQLMQQIASMAQAMGSTQQEQPEPQSPAATSPDPQMLQAMVKTFGSTGVDNNQKALLQALSPYLSSYRVQKLERAMQAAKLAGAASGFLSAGGLQMLTGR